MTLDRWGYKEELLENIRNISDSLSKLVKIQELPYKNKILQMRCRKNKDKMSQVNHVWQQIIRDMKHDRFFETGEVKRTKNRRDKKTYEIVESRFFENKDKEQKLECQCYELLYESGDKLTHIDNTIDIFEDIKWWEFKNDL